MYANCMRLGSIEAMHNGLVALGVILLLIGLFASFYYESNDARAHLGIILIIVGVFLVVVGVLYPHREEEVHTQEELIRLSKDLPRA